MNFAMIGVDYQSATIAQREAVSLTKARTAQALSDIHETYELGVVILSTCNRTEFYFSSKTEMDDETLVEIYEQVVQADCPYYIRRGQVLVDYLFALTCGLHSMILGEDQIITQVKDALEQSMEQKAGNAPLNTLFRHSVTCAKKAKTEVNIQFISPSIVSRAVDMAKQKVATLAQKKVLVIGNGEMGRLAAECFLKEGCEVYMTLRAYKYHQSTVPEGCTAIAYEERVALFETVDLVVSATKSPHYTVHYNDVTSLQKKPSYFFDLALPRDISPRIKSLQGVSCYDVDEIGAEQSHYDQKAIAQIYEIIQTQQVKFHQWTSYYQALQKEECR